jgi:hypothetical protein
MMQAPPYHLNEDLAKVDARFLKERAEIRKARPGVDAHLVGFTSGGPEISDYMRKIRVHSLDERRAIYLSERLLDQKRWYEAKARDNRSSASTWFWTIAAVQVLALALAIVQSAVGQRSVNLVSILMTLVASFVAWTQVKRHEELVQSYGLASQELNALETQERHVSDSTMFQEFVTQVEEAISREHTMWCARRNISLAINRT